MKTQKQIPLYGEIDLPHPPKSLVDEIMEVALDEDKSVPEAGRLYDELGTKIWFREIKDIDDTYGKGRPNIRFDLNQAADDWVRENICKTHDGAFVNVVYQTDEGGATTAPIHTDMSRDWVLIYLLETSNPDQSTKFWREKGQPIVRDRSIFLNHWDDCEKIGEVSFELHKWYFMNARVLHSIHNIIGDRRGRIAIQVKIDDPLTPDRFYNKVDVKLSVQDDTLEEVK